MMFSVFHIVVDESCPSLLYRVASVHCGLQVFKYAQLSYGLEAWTLSLSLLNCDSFLFFLPLCCTFAAVLGVIVLLHEPVWAKL